jgi:hypothetical protein
MFILFKLWKSKAWWIFFSIFIISVSLVGGIIGYIGSKGYFEREVKVIGHKYCYFYNENNLVDRAEHVMASNHINTAKDVYNYYKLLLQPKANDTITFIMPDDINYVSKSILVDLIKYSSDSSLVLVRAKWKIDTKPFDIDITGYVPSFTLHDTLPTTKD